MKRKSLKTFFSDNCTQNIFDIIRLPSFSTNIDKNEVCTKKIDQIFKKINTDSPSYIKKMSIDKKKKMPPEKYGINMGLKRELIKKM